MATFQFNWSNLPEGYCWTGPQKYMDDIFGRLIGTLPEGAISIVQSTLPKAEDQGKVWFRTNPDGTLEGIYLYQGFWHRPHPVEPLSKSRMIWTGTELELWSFEGGSGNPPNVLDDQFTGPMWVVDTAFDFRFPLGIGANNIGTAPGFIAPDTAATVINQGSTGGSEKNVSTPIDHVHLVGKMRTNSGTEADDVSLLTGVSSITTGAARGVHAGSNANFSENISDATGENIVAHIQEKVGGGPFIAANQTNMPPYKAVVYAKRTVRKFIIRTT